MRPGSNQTATYIFDLLPQDSRADAAGGWILYHMYVVLVLAQYAALFTEKLLQTSAVPVNTTRIG